MKGTREMSISTATEAKAQLLEAIRFFLTNKPFKLHLVDVTPNLGSDEVGLTKTEAYEVFTLTANLDVDWERTNTIAGRQRAWNKPGTDGTMGGGNRSKWDVTRKAMNFVANEFVKSGDLDTATAAKLSKYDAFKSTANNFKWLCDNYEMITDHLKGLKSNKGKNTK
jgi:hypothetical protein